MAREQLQATIGCLLELQESEDPYTVNHQVRVTLVVDCITRDLGIDDQCIRSILMGAAIHDIGKIMVPAEILTKREKLTERDWEMIREHPKYGYDILTGLSFPDEYALAAVLQHHELMDGSGYPNRLKGGQICLGARVIAVADAFAVIVYGRPYQPAQGVDRALEAIKQGRSSHFSPEVVDAAMRCLPKVPDWELRIAV